MSARWVILLILTVILNVSMSSQEKEKSGSPSATDSVSIQSYSSENEYNALAMFWKSVGIVLGLSLCLYLILKLIKNGVAGKNIGKNSMPLEVVARTTIGYKKSIVVVKTLDRYLVVGMGEHEISSLMEVPAEEVKLQPDGGPPFNKLNEPGSIIELIRKINHKT